MSALVVVTPPSKEPLTIAEVKSHLGITSNDYDSAISRRISAARDWVEIWTRRALITRTYAYKLERWPRKAIVALPMPPLQSVSSVKYYDTSDTEQTLSASEYKVDAVSMPGRVWFGYGMPSTSDRPLPISIQYTAGYGNPSSVPATIKEAMLLLLGHWMDFQGDIQSGMPRTVPWAVEQMLSPYRVHEFGYGED